MPIESSVTKPSDLNVLYPEDGDLKAIGPQHFRNVKTSLKYLQTSAGATEVNTIRSETGATSRTLQAKLREFVSPEDFGCVGDGTTDDKANLQKALDTGKRVKLTHGATYKISGTLTVPSNGGLIGDGSPIIYMPAASFTNTTLGTSIAPPSGSVGIDCSGLISGAYTATDNICLEGFKVKSDTNDSRWLCGISARNTTNFTIKDVELYNFPLAHVIRLDSVRKASLKNVFIHDCLTNVVWSTAGVAISSITRSGTTATLTTGSAHGLATGAYVTVSGATPAQYNGNFTITVTGATTFTYTMSADPGGSASPVGSYVSLKQPQMTGIEIDQNRVNSLFSEEIEIDGAVIRDVTFGATAKAAHSNESDGIHVAHSSKRIKITNFLIDTTGEGIDYFGHDGVIANGQLIDCNKSGLKIFYGARGNTGGNIRIIRPGLAGVLVGSDSSTNGDVEHNSFKNISVEDVDPLGEWAGGTWKDFILPASRPAAILFQLNGTPTYTPKYNTFDGLTSYQPAGNLNLYNVVSHETGTDNRVLNVEHTGATYSSAFASLGGTGAVVQRPDRFGGTTNQLRYRQFDSEGKAIARFDDNSDHTRDTIQNYAIDGSGQGGYLRSVGYGTGGTFGQYAFRERVETTANWSGAGNRSAKMMWSLAAADTVTPVLEASGTEFGVLVPLTNTSSTLTSPTIAGTVSLSATAITQSATMTQTRAMGAAPAGNTNPWNYLVTFSGNAAGTTDVRALRSIVTASGANDIADARVRYAGVNVALDSGKTAALAYTDHLYLSVSDAGNLTTGRVYYAHYTLPSTGSIVDARCYEAGDIIMAGTGTVTNSVGLRVAGIGHATKVTNAYGVQVANFTAATLAVGVDIATTSGAGKWGLRQTGDANNALTGNLRIGSTTAPTVALDVTGAANVSGAVKLGVLTGNGVVTTTGGDGTLTVVAPDSYTSTGTGFTVPPTCTTYWTLVGNTVTLDFATELSGTSNATTLTVAGMPANLRPARAKAHLCMVKDNGGAVVAALCSIGTDGVITVYATTDGGAFTASGTKSFRAISLHYTLA